VRIFVLSLWAWTIGFAIATAITLSFDPRHAWPSACLMTLTGATALRLRRRRVCLELRFPELTFHLEVLPNGIVKPVLDDPSALNPHLRTKDSE